MSDWHNEEERGWRRKRFSIFGPLLLIAVGVVLFLKTFGVIEGSLWDLFLTTWPILFIVSGLDSLYRGDGYVGGVVWAGFGVILLLGNLGYLQIATWNAILRLWPFMFIVWGLDILFHRRRWWSAAGGILAGLVVLAVMFWMITSAPAAQRSEMVTFETPLEDASQATIEVEAITGELWIGAGAGASNLVEGEIDIVEGEEVERSYIVEDGAGEFVLKSEAFWFGGAATNKNWHLELNSVLPLNVNTRMIVGEQTANFTGLRVVDAFQETVIGKSSLYLSPDSEGDFEASLIIGEMLVYVMPGTSLEIRMDTGITSVEFPDDFTREDDTLYSPSFEEGEDALILRVNLPIGSLHVRYIE